MQKFIPQPHPTETKTVPPKKAITAAERIVLEAVKTGASNLMLHIMAERSGKKIKQ